MCFTVIKAKICTSTWWRWPAGAAVQREGGRAALSAASRSKVCLVSMATKGLVLQWCCAGRKGGTKMHYIHAVNYEWERHKTDREGEMSPLSFCYSVCTFENKKIELSLPRCHWNETNKCKCHCSSSDISSVCQCWSRVTCGLSSRRSTSNPQQQENCFIPAHALIFDADSLCNDQAKNHNTGYKRQSFPD